MVRIAQAQEQHMDGVTVWSSAVDGSHVAKLPVFWGLSARPESAAVFCMLPQASSNFGFRRVTQGSRKLLNEGRANPYTRVAQTLTRGSRKLWSKPWRRVMFACRLVVHRLAHTAVPNKLVDVQCQGSAHCTACDLHLMLCPLLSNCTRQLVKFRGSRKAFTKEPACRGRCRCINSYNQEVNSREARRKF